MDYKKIVYPNDPALQNFIQLVEDARANSNTVFGNNNVAGPLSLQQAPPGDNASNNTSFGINALDNLVDTTDNSNNTAYGFEALLGITELKSSGENTAVGCQAMANIPDGVNGAVALGYQAGNDMSSYSVAVGYRAGYQSQDIESIAIGTNAGSENQKIGAIAIGHEAGYSGQNEYSVAVGYQSGYTGQKASAIAIGYRAGYTGQRNEGIGIGIYAGGNSQNPHAIAIGSFAGNSLQSTGAISIGRFAGQNSQGTGAVAIGYECGINNQSKYSIAVGYRAGVTQSASSIILNASGTDLNDGGIRGFFVNPVTGSTGALCCYNNSNSMIGYASGINIESTGSVNIIYTDGIKFANPLSDTIPGNIIRYYENFYCTITFSKNSPIGYNNFSNADTTRTLLTNVTRCGSLINMNWTDEVSLCSNINNSILYGTVSLSDNNKIKFGSAIVSKLLYSKNSNGSVVSIGLLNTTILSSAMVLYPDYSNLATGWNSTSNNNNLIGGNSITWSIQS